MSFSARVLIVDDEPAICRSLKEFLLDLNKLVNGIYDLMEVEDK